MRIFLTIAFAWSACAVGLAAALCYCARWLREPYRVPVEAPAVVAPETDTDWLDEQPVECLSDAEINRRFAVITAGVR